MNKSTDGNKKYDPLTVALNEYFARNKYAFGVEVLSMAPDLSEVHVRITFISGNQYCCAEAGCHFSMSGLRSIAREQGLVLPERMRVFFHGEVEGGAELECLEQFGLSRYSDSYEYEAEFSDVAE